MDQGLLRVIRATVAELACETRTENRADRVIKVIIMLLVTVMMLVVLVSAGWSWLLSLVLVEAVLELRKVVAQRLEFSDQGSAGCCIRYLSVISVYTHVYGMILPRAKLVLELALPGRFYHSCFTSFCLGRAS